MTTVKLNAAYFPAVEFLSALVTVEILVVGGIEVINGHTSTGVVFAFVAALNNFFDPIQQLSQLYTTYQSGMAALDKIFELLDEQPDLVDAPDAVELPSIRGELRFDDVSFRYGSDRRRMRLYALRDVDLVIPPGQTVALVGATGAGKSTFAKLVARFYDPTSGAVLVDGHDLRDVTAESLRSQMGIVPQEGVPVQRHDPREHRVRPARRGATRSPRRGARGRRRFVHRGARATATTPRSASAASSSPPGSVSSWPSPGRSWPTRGFSCWTRRPRTSTCTPRRLIEKGLRRLVAGRTAIVIAHRLSTIRGAGRILVLEHGRVVEDGHARRAARRRAAATGGCIATGPSRRRRRRGRRVVGARAHAGQGHAAARRRRARSRAGRACAENRRFYVIDARDRMVNSKIARRASDDGRRVLARRTGDCGSSFRTGGWSRTRSGWAMSVDTRFFSAQRGAASSKVRGPRRSARWPAGRFGWSSRARRRGVDRGPRGRCR